MAHIFISYSHKDKAYVEKLEARLIGEGFDVWVDHRIDYGSRWTQEIERAIDTCAAYIVVMSENSAKSRWVQRERNHAEKRGKPLFPLLLKREGWFSLNDTQFVDVTGGKLPPADFYEDLAKFVPRKAGAASIGAGVKPGLKNKQPLIIAGIALGVLVLALLGVMLNNIFSEPAPPVEVALKTSAVPVVTIPVTPVDLDPVDPTDIPATNIPAPTQDPNKPPADAQLADTWTRPTDGMLMSYIPAGEFQMGSEDGGDDEKPVHTVYLDGFWMDQTEVTNAMYATCVTNGRCEEPSDRTYFDNPLYANHPVVYVDWEAANNYCEKVGGRLPTEAEWEKAARGGLEGKKYPWGDEEPVCVLGAENGANFYGCNASGTENVGSFSANGYGLYDMAGNVWEWVADWYGEYPALLSPLENPTGPLSGGYRYRVLRGGAWVINEYFSRSADRVRVAPDYYNSYFGFRCVRSP